MIFSIAKPRSNDRNSKSVVGTQGDLSDSCWSNCPCARIGFAARLRTLLMRMPRGSHVVIMGDSLVFYRRIRQM